MDFSPGRKGLGQKWAKSWPFVCLIITKILNTFIILVNWVLIIVTESLKKIDSLLVRKKLKFHFCCREVNQSKLIKNIEWTIVTLKWKSVMKME